MVMTIKKYLHAIRDNITWNDEYFDKYNQGCSHFTKDFIVQFDYNPKRKFRVNTFCNMITRIIQVKNEIKIYKVSKSDVNGVLILTIQESHPMWNKFAFRLNRFERARTVYKDRSVERDLLKVFDAEFIVATGSTNSDYGTHITLEGSNRIIILDNEAELAHHLLVIK